MQVNEICKTHRPQGRVIAILNSPNQSKDQMCMLKELKDANDKKKGKNVRKEIMLEPVDRKLPWLVPCRVPREYREDIEAGRNPSHRYYVVRIKEWTQYQKKPVCEVLESIGEAGNLEAESMRLLRMYDICDESYETEDMEPTNNEHESLKMFAVDPLSKE